MNPLEFVVFFENFKLPSSDFNRDLTLVDSIWSSRTKAPDQKQIGVGSSTMFRELFAGASQTHSRYLAG